jgi:hypothetical protein|tara:strand:+ start:356 stop:508 length:153 start_codon:yes stop_codon:yes gene_type:complete
MYSLPHEYYFGWAFMAWLFFCLEAGLDAMPMFDKLGLKLRYEAEHYETQQ